MSVSCCFLFNKPKQLDIINLNLNKKIVLPIVSYPFIALNEANNFIVKFNAPF